MCKTKTISSKRKAREIPSASAKRPKKQCTTLSRLPWKTVDRPSETRLDGDDGVLELEEVENVEVVYEDAEGGRIVKFNVLKSLSNTTSTSEDSEQEADVLPAAPNPPISSVSFDSQSLLPNWHDIGLHSHLLQVIYSRGFATPTPIQARSLSLALQGRDIIGIAETGSGKTLAYGLPILHDILVRPRPPRTQRELQALILAPTRELALQVSDHLNAFARVLSVKDEEDVPVDLRNTIGKDRQHDNKTAPPLVSITAIVGGMSVQRQRRILHRGVDVLVATPGRLWDILEEDEGLANKISHLRFLVLDEADRMVEAGHFAEMDNIMRLTIRKSQEDEIGSRENQSDSVDRHQDTECPAVALIDTLQTFVFSATLSKDLQKNLKHRFLQNSHRRKPSKSATTLDDLLLRLDFRDPDPIVIDISPEGCVVSTLKESKIECLPTDKDAYLYYFLLRYPGRSLVFLSSIDGIRRLVPLMELLSLEAFPLHSQLEQRQRLRNLDRFKATTNAVLLATDIAARGLDIPAVDHVVHYQVPRSADVLVHRNGRTARAMQKGFSLLMIAPDERGAMKALLASLGRKDTEIPEMSVTLTLIDKLKNRIMLARKIDTQQHKIKKQNHEKNWMRDTAKAMEIELDSDILSESAEDCLTSKQRTKQNSVKIAGLKAELKDLLSQPLISRGISTRYITSGSRHIADDIISGEVHETMLGFKKTEAGDDIVAVKKTPMNKEHDDGPEEWHGIGS